MPDQDLPDEIASDGGWLADYRCAVERLRGETVAEFGSQPMPPEKLSAIAIAVASLPMVALLLPTIPVEPKVWQVALSLVMVWLVAFRVQSVRYERFEDRWHRKIAAHDAAASASYGDGLRFLRDR